MLLHNLKIAIRNLLKYKLQTIISIASIAIGIVVLAAVHVIMVCFQMPAVTQQPFFDRAVCIRLESTTGDNENVQLMKGGDMLPGQQISAEMLKALKANGGMNSIEKGSLTYFNRITMGGVLQFMSGDTLLKQKQMDVQAVDPHYPNYSRYISATTGKGYPDLKVGEAIISEFEAKALFGDRNPVGITFEVYNGEEYLRYTIIDVYKNRSAMDLPQYPHALLFCMGSIEDQPYPQVVAYALSAVLKEGKTQAQLEKEATARVAPLGLKATVRMESEEYANSVANVSIARIVAYSAGSLILIAALIGFLRMQIQLFWMRRREISIRIVNGAKRGQLFRLLLHEVMMIIICAVGVSLLLGEWLKDFVEYYLNYIVDEGIANLHVLAPTCILIGALLIPICALIVWFTLGRICKAGDGLAANMHRNRTHHFRNVMLGVQIAISMLFIVCAIMIANMESPFNIPADTSVYKHSGFIRANYTKKLTELREELKHIHSIQHLIPVSDTYCATALDDPEQKYGGIILNNKLAYRTWLTSNAALPDFWQLSVKRIGRKTDRNHCVYIQQELYQKLDSLGLIVGGKIELTWQYDHTYLLPVAGTYEKLPYENSSLYEHQSILLVNADIANELDDFILEPKDGEYDRMMRVVSEAIERTDPTIANQMLFNYHVRCSEYNRMAEAMQTGSMALAIVALIICTMGIYSTIMLDTRSRSKEVAIRKINGAKRKDIIRLFGRLYIGLSLCAILVAVPFSVLFNQILFSAAESKVPSPLCPILLGVGIVLLMILLIVGMQIHRIMRINPAEIIAKE